MVYNDLKPGVLQSDLVQKGQQPTEAQAVRKNIYKMDWLTHLYLDVSKCLDMHRYALVTSSCFKQKFTRRYWGYVHADTGAIGSCKSYKMNGMEPSDMIRIQTKNATGTISASPKTYNKAMHSITSTPGLSHLHGAP